jgi:hypothetical protein
MAVALGGVGVRRGAEHGIDAGWNDHRCSWMALVQGGVHAGSVIAAVAQDEFDRVSNLIEQGSDLRGVIDVAVGQDGGDDPAAYRVKADMLLFGVQSWVLRSFLCTSWRRRTHRLCRGKNPPA